MAGFLDAAARAPARAARAGERPLVVLPSYNGARQLPVLTPLLALLLAREGAAGADARRGHRIEPRASCRDVLARARTCRRWRRCRAGRATARRSSSPTELLCPGLKRLLDVRRVVGLRNSGAQPGQADEPLRRRGRDASAATRIPNTRASMAAVFELHAARRRCCCAAPKARRWPTRAACRRWTASSRGRRVPLQEGQQGHADRPARPAAARSTRNHGRLHPRRAGGRQAGAGVDGAAGGTHLASGAAHEHARTSHEPHGKVTLVGAGPGDPELLTLKAREGDPGRHRAAGRRPGQRRDRGAMPRHGARIVHVGKRGGCKSTPQAFIEKLMVMAAREGENVVRLKGGDPFIFGRGGEEVEHLRAAGIEVEVVNGITSGPGRGHLARRAADAPRPRARRGLRHRPCADRRATAPTGARWPPPRATRG